MGFGTLMLVLNAVFLWSYSLSCHSCRHVVGGRLKHFSRHPVRFKLWGFVSKLNARHMQIAWMSLVFVAPNRSLCPPGRGWLGPRPEVFLKCLAKKPSNTIPMTSS